MLNSENTSNGKNYKECDYIMNKDDLKLDIKYDLQYQIMYKFQVKKMNTELNSL